MDTLNTIFKNLIEQWFAPLQITDVRLFIENRAVLSPLFGIRSALTVLS